ncbi:MAG: acyltransferase [Patescibacteria group bacterium]|jgi:surface polysaccharide O-acyltransferase-like enzyme|nr:acyltransferase [Patescibacteria group bacterium]
MIEELVYLGLTSFLVLTIPILRKIYFSEERGVSITSERKGRYDFFDYLRGLAIIAVIVIHIGDSFYVEQSGNQVFIKLINNISRFAVPFFFISSGILLVRGNSLRQFFLNKTTRTFLPYFLITIMVGVYYNAGVLEIIRGFFAGKASLPYYFMAILLQFYLIYPFLVKYSKKKYFLHITFLITIIALFIEASWSFYGIPLFPRYLFLFAYGISQKDRFLSNSFSLGLKGKSFWIIVVLYYLFSSIYFQAYLYNVRIFYAIALFNLLFLLKDTLKNIPSYSFFCYLGRNSLWIYLIHYFIIQLIYPIAKQVSDNFYLQYLYFIVVGVPVSILLSLGFKLIYTLIVKTVKINPVK